MNDRVEILGCSASGKTTLCTTLNKLGWNIVFEPYEQNPFLSKHFNGSLCGFELQMCFLLQHYNAINSKSYPGNFFCDFSFLLDSIYASILLNEEEKSVYNTLYNYLTSKIEEPKCLIKLTCPNDVILDRLRRRNREYENGVSADFLIELNQRISNFSINGHCIEIDSSLIDITNGYSVKKHILSQI